MLLFVAAHWETQRSDNLIPLCGYNFCIIIFTIILICDICNCEQQSKILSQYEINGLPITITHMSHICHCGKSHGKMCNSRTIVDKKGQESKPPSNSNILDSLNHICTIASPHISRTPIKGKNLTWLNLKLETNFFLWEKPARK